MYLNFLLCGLAFVGMLDALGMEGTSPHLVFVFLDDFGWANTGVHSPPGSNESVTPVMDELVSSGLNLDRHHVFKYCSPSRSAFHTGRNPLHVNVLNSFLDQHNPEDPVSGYQGIPRNMSNIARKLKAANYSTHQVGKWHLGVGTPAHTVSCCINFASNLTPPR